MPASPHDQLRVFEQINSPEDAHFALAVTLWGQLSLPPEWHDEAACAGTNERLWFSDALSQAALAERERLCAGCPVRTECAKDAARFESTAFGKPHGYIAGRTAAQRTADNNKNPVQSLRNPTTTHSSYQLDDVA